MWNYNHLLLNLRNLLGKFPDVQRKAKLKKLLKVAYSHSQMEIPYNTSKAWHTRLADSRANKEIREQIEGCASLMQWLIKEDRHHNTSLQVVAILRESQEREQFHF